MTDRTDEQHMADVAAATLANLTELHDSLSSLRVQLQFLSNWATEHQPDMRHKDRPDMLHHQFLAVAAYLVGALTYHGCVPDMVRDIAATLPIRGLDYGDEINR
jgi:hypothetical protein